MKKSLITSLLSVILVFGMWSCGSNSPETTARKFLEAFYNYDLDTAARYADENGKKQIAEVKASYAGDTSEHEKVLVEIVEIEENGDEAVCTFILKNAENDANAIPEEIFLHKNNDTWEVRW